MGALIVTEKNVNKLPIKKLVQHYKKIERQLSKAVHPYVQQELLKEKETIYHYLKDKDEANLIQEQLVIPGLLPEKEHYEAIVENKLREYYINQLKVKRLLRRLEEGFQIVFPSNISNAYGNTTAVSGGYNEYQSSSERAVIINEVDRKEKIKEEIWELKDLMLEVELGLEQLDELERDYVEKKYFVKVEPTNLQLIADMPVEKTKFYEIKHATLLKLAEAFLLI